MKTIDIIAGCHYLNDKTTVIKAKIHKDAYGWYACATKTQVNAAKRRIGLAVGDYLDYSCEYHDADICTLSENPDGEIIVAGSRLNEYLDTLTSN